MNKIHLINYIVISIIKIFIINILLLNQMLSVFLLSIDKIFFPNPIYNKVKILKLNIIIFKLYIKNIIIIIVIIIMYILYYTLTSPPFWVKKPVFVSVSCQRLHSWQSRQSAIVFGVKISYFI